MSGEFEDQIIESAPEIVANLANQDSDAHPDTCFDGRDKFECMRRIRVELWDDCILLMPEGVADSLPQISKVFFCPPYSFESAIEFVERHDFVR